MGCVLGSLWIGRRERHERHERCERHGRRERRAGTCGCGCLGRGCVGLRVGCGCVVVCGSVRAVEWLHVCVGE